jgi:hypothetical protein
MAAGENPTAIATNANVKAFKAARTKVARHRGGFIAIFK